jgi:hypothetical protein
MSAQLPHTRSDPHGEFEGADDARCPNCISAELSSTKLRVGLLEEKVQALTARLNEGRASPGHAWSKPLKKPLRVPKMSWFILRDMSQLEAVLQANLDDVGLIVEKVPQVRDLIYASPQVSGETVILACRRLEAVGSLVTALVDMYTMSEEVRRFLMSFA